MSTRYEEPSPTDLDAASAAGLEQLVELLGGGRVLVLTGAGVSTASGIPDYRDAEGAWKHRQPMQIREFFGSEAARRRYFARSLVGFARLGDARPNAAHRALAALEGAGLVTALVTQNVDGLHQAAGSRNVVDLHGRIDRVICVGCRRVTPRAELQRQLAEQNPSFVARAATTTPDGDAELGDVDYGAFRLIDCAACAGVLKPDVVFFGEGVPAERVQSAMTALEEARALVVVGSSLMVFSGYRFARAAARRSIPLVLVNQGRTRADELATLKITAEAGAVLTAAVRALANAQTGASLRSDGEAARPALAPRSARTRQAT